ncbi:MAG: aldo/keto reductase [Pseudomonadota bacterium]
MHTLTANGANIPALGLGTWELRGDTCSHIVEQAVRGGYTHIDTAIMYDNETAVGAGIRASGVARDDLFVTTKVWPTDVTEASFLNAVEGSLRRLEMDAVDLLLIHWPPKTAEPTVWAHLLNSAADRGLTRNIGVSNFNIAQINAMVAASERPIACNQVENHPYLDQRRLRAACAANGIALIAYCPIYRGGPMFEEPAVLQAAATHAKTPAQIVLRWHVQHGGAGAIPKTATPGRLVENKAIFDFALSDSEMAAITALTLANKRLCDFEFSPVWDAA